MVPRLTIDLADPALRLRCPRCGAPLARAQDGWACARDGEHRFRSVDGVPILINPARSIFRDGDFHPRSRTTFKDPSAWALRIGAWLPAPSRDVSAEKCQQALARWLAARPADARRVLVVGCGDGGARYGALATVVGAHWLETDVSLAGQARLVCDASDLPFDDQQFDLVICIAVLEHVVEPQRCVDEMRRVLRSDGRLYATTPFMQQVHMGEYDFTRFTHSGHRWLFREFTEIDSGVATGPASVLVWSVEYFLMAWTTSIAARRIIKGCTRLLLGWLTWLDVPLARRRAASDAAGGFFFVGQKAESATVSARDLVRYYRGADAQK